MNKFADWSLFGGKKNKCAKCGMSNNGCCKDEIKQNTELIIRENDVKYPNVMHTNKN